MNYIDRIQNYEPILDKWNYDSIMAFDSYNFLIKAGANTDPQQEGYLLMKTVYSDNLDLEITKWQEDLLSNQEGVAYNIGGFEQFLIEDANGEVVGCDFFWEVIPNEELFNLDFFTNNQLYEIGYQYYQINNLEEAVTYFEKAALHNDDRSLVMLAYFYMEGIYFPRDPLKAVELYKQGAAYDNPHALSVLGNLYHLGEYVEADNIKSYQYLKKAAGLDEAFACYLLGYAYQYGEFGQVDLIKAKNYYEKGAKLGSVAALYVLGTAYLNNDFMIQDYHLAYRYNLQAAYQGYPYAQVQLGGLFLNGYGVEPDDNASFYWTRLACEANLPSGILNHGLDYLMGVGTAVDFKKARYYLQKAARTGLVNALTAITRFYVEHEEVPNNLLRARYWALVGAKAGVGNLMITYASLVSNDEQGKKRDERAFFWYQKAIEAGHYECYNDLGNCYNLGCGVAQDYAKAIECYLAAYQNGDVIAMFNLGLAYSTIAEYRDYALAIKYYTEGMEQGDLACEYELANLYLDNSEVRDERLGLELLRDLVDREYPKALGKYGLLVLAGELIPQNIPYGLSLLQQAAVSQPSIYDILGNFYYLGTIVEKDLTKAGVYFQEAYNHQVYKHSHFLGYLYEDGYFGEVTDKEIFKIYQQAAADNQFCKFEVANYLIQGKGVARDLALGIGYLKELSATGFALASSYLFEVYLEIDRTEALEYGRLAMTQGIGEVSEVMLNMIKEYIDEDD